MTLSPKALSTLPPFLLYLVPILFSALLFPSLLFAADSTAALHIDLDGSYVKGRTINHMSFDNSWAAGGHGESELEFPVANYFYGLRLEAVEEDASVAGGVRASLAYSYRRAVSGYAGTMKDSDWIENDLAICGVRCSANTPGRDLYSESDDDLERGVHTEISYTYYGAVGPTISVGAVFGYSRFELFHKVTGGSGVYWDTPVTFADATVITFDVDHRMPYVGLTSVYRPAAAATFELSVLYSDWVSVDYVDTHLYPDWDAANAPNNRDRRFVGSTEGDGYVVRGKGEWRVSGGFALYLAADYTDMTTAGGQNQETYLNGVLVGFNTGLVYTTVDSEYWSFTVGIKGRFM